MLAGAAVKEDADSVEILEAHEPPAGPEPRTGVPQAPHIRRLQAGGAEAIEALLSGSIGLLTAAGAHRIPVTTDMVIYSPEGWYRRRQHATHYVITASQVFRTAYYARRTGSPGPRALRDIELTEAPGGPDAARLVVPSPTAPSRSEAPAPACRCHPRSGRPR
ncbi:hypothetical protein [Streptomyces sp. TE12347]